MLIYLCNCVYIYTLNGKLIYREKKKTKKKIQTIGHVSLYCLCTYTNINLKNTKK